jgi:hypothetical protein
MWSLFQWKLAIREEQLQWPAGKLDIANKDFVQSTSFRPHSLSRMGRIYQVHWATCFRVPEALKNTHSEDSSILNTRDSHTSQLALAVEINAYFTLRDLNPGGGLACRKTTLIAIQWTLTMVSTAALLILNSKTVMPSWLRLVPNSVASFLPQVRIRTSELKLKIFQR